jgi:hypothetical protein
VARDPQAKAIGDRLRAEIARAGTALTLEITANLIEATPVDTGHARANWVPSIGAPHLGEDSGAAQVAGQTAVFSYRLGDGPLCIANNASYIERLIGGSSSQAPSGWDLEAIDHAQQTVQQQYDALDIDVTVGSAGPTATIAPRGGGRRP